MTPAGGRAAAILHRAYEDRTYRDGPALDDMKQLALTVDVGSQAEREVCDSGTMLSKLISAGSMSPQLGNLADETRENDMDCPACGCPDTISGQIELTFNPAEPRDKRGRWHFDPQDTPQQRTILRSQRTAQSVRSRFPAGTRVRARVSGELGTVQRHVPGTNAQGGTLVIKWDRTGVTGRHGPISIEPVTESQPS